ncbi:MAG: DUF177 domain-containing protein [Gammaproteobacteria bacterium]|nr:DUF177 domain-containing protein [Gammaproteobacteria bacterium]MDH4315438.1 DUF177 domain-containing protein [Gammaproteobacteria bacterium]MDH5215593.1 DUF177 domain-containing protein [Gammaproteobacteria bacterium]MDH5501249.1 DUF177 domain-containing protein [Gammaproteobacteria bacterium]
MASPLTERATPAELAERSQAIETKEEILSFPRLSEIIETDLAGVPFRDSAAKWRQLPVQIRLRFGWADSRREIVSLVGEIRARLVAVCQRCLEPFEFGVNADLKLLLLPPGTRGVDGGDYEVWELDEAWLKPADLVEEAVIMALPMVARHDDETECKPMVSDAPPVRRDTVRPFAGLRSQLTDSN